MKISIANLGPIQSFEMDLSKDLTLIFGRNNIGKSYAISAVYLILKHLIQFEPEQQFERYQLQQFNKSLKTLTRQLQTGSSHPKGWYQKRLSAFLASQEQTLDLSAAFGEALQDFLNQTLLKELHASFANTFGSVEHIQNKHQAQPFQLNLQMNHFHLQLGLQAEGLQVTQLTLQRKVLLKKKNTHHGFRQSAKALNFYIDPLHPEIHDLNHALVIGLYWLKEAVQAYEATYFLPASRSGLYTGLNTFNVMVAELSQKRTELNQPQFNLPTIPEPVSDYFLQLSSLKSSQVLNPDLIRLAEEMERQLLAGKIAIDTETRTLRYQPQELDIELDLAFTSSMVSEIAPIIAHFKYIIADKSRRLKAEQEQESIIFIEEPEAHLHPELQVKLTEIFEKLSHANVKIVLTTHSNYIFNKLSNLLLAGKLSPEQVGVLLMCMGAQGSYLAQDAMQVDEDGIEDDNFLQVSEALFQERISLYDEANENAD